MSDYRYLNTQACVYVDRALTVEPGDVVDWPDGAPDDGQWEPVAKKTPKAPPKAAPNTEE